MARSAGASGAAAVTARDISAEQELARLCRRPRCPNYGLSLSCPPHVTGPEEFRRCLRGVEHAVLVKIELPDQALHEDDRRWLGRLVHEMVAGMEQRARERGYGRARAFAGGSCKNLFCHQHAECRVLGQGGSCRNPGQARPSLSGFGVNTLKLTKAAGWTRDERAQAARSGQSAPQSMYGLVLVG